MELPHYYKLLKIEQNADLETIKKAFRKEIALYHPDKNPSKNTREHFDLLVEAFDVLSHPEKRKAYDTLLEQRLHNKPIIVETKQEQEQEEPYKTWKKEAKKKSDTFWNTDLADLLVLDLFLDAGLSSLFSGTDELLDGIGDSLGDIFDIF